MRLPRLHPRPGASCPAPPAPAGDLGVAIFSVERGGRKIGGNRPCQPRCWRGATRRRPTDPSSDAKWVLGRRLNRHPQRFPLCGLPAVWCIGAFRAPVIDTPRVPKMCNLRLPARNPPVKGSDLSSGERGEFAGGFQAHGRNHDGYDRSSNGWGCGRRGRREPQNRRNIWGNARGGRVDGVKGNRVGKLVEKQLAPPLGFELWLTL